MLILCKSPFPSFLIRQTKASLVRTDHFYPAEDWLLTKDIGLMNGQSKSYYVGELDWTGQVSYHFRGSESYFNFNL